MEDTVYGRQRYTLQRRKQSLASVQLAGSVGDIIWTQGYTNMKMPLSLGLQSRWLNCDIYLQEQVQILASPRYISQSSPHQTDRFPAETGLRDYQIELLLSHSLRERQIPVYIRGLIESGLAPSTSSSYATGPRAEGHFCHSAIHSAVRLPDCEIDYPEL